MPSWSSPKIATVPHRPQITEDRCSMLQHLHAAAVKRIVRPMEQPIYAEEEVLPKTRHAV